MESMDDLNAILKQFDRAARTYEDNSEVQRDIASALANQLMATCQPPQSVFELGCGTGNLTRQLATQYPSASIIATDASERMLSEAARIVDVEHVQFQPFVLESQPDLGGHFDLVVSNMTLQWLADLESTLEWLLQQCDQLAFTIPVEGTFANWKQAHESAGLEDGVRDFLTDDELLQMVGTYPKNCLEFEDFKVHFDQPIDFVRNLRLMGGSTPKTNHRPVELKHVFRQFPKGIEITYRIAFVILKSA